jgi:hypothetical protein
VYNPTTGRWLSRDPIGFKAGDANLYRYVANRPTYHTDPSGLYAQQQQQGCQKDCCCCIDEFRIDVLKKIPQEYKPKGFPEENYGHVFRALVGVTLNVAKKHEFCKLTWKEKSNIVPKGYPAACKPDQWCTLPDTMDSAVFTNWQNAKKVHECPKTFDPFSMVDLPSMPFDKDRRFRYLCFDVKVESTCPAGMCKNASKGFKAVQVVEFNQKGEITKQTFELDKACEYPKKGG